MHQCEGHPWSKLEGMAAACPPPPSSPGNKKMLYCNPFISINQFDIFKVGVFVNLPIDFLLVCQKKNELCPSHHYIPQFARITIPNKRLFNIVYMYLITVLFGLFDVASTCTYFHWPGMVKAKYIYRGRRGGGVQEGGISYLPAVGEVPWILHSLPFVFPQYRESGHAPRPAPDQWGPDQETRGGGEQSSSGGPEGDLQGRKTRERLVRVHLMT